MRTQQTNVQKGAINMDLQKIITDVVAKLKGNPDLLKDFVANPVQMLEKTFGIDLPDEQINQVIDGIKGQVDLSSLTEATGLIDKIKGFFGK